MQKITVKKNELLVALRANRDAHYELFLKAQEGFKKKIVEALEQRIEAARKGRRIEMYINLSEPINKTDAYDTAIEMLEMDVRDEVELSREEFRNFVKDTWEWSAAARATNSGYVEHHVDYDTTG